jgi:hypothetical protein
MGGFLDFHQVPGFLENKQELATADDEETGTAAFLAQWYTKFKSEPKLATELVESARVDTFDGQWFDPWAGAFPSTYKDGKSISFTARGLGKYLSTRRDRIFAGYTLRGDLDKKNHRWSYRVLNSEEADQ